MTTRRPRRRRRNWRGSRRSTGRSRRRRVRLVRGDLPVEDLIVSNRDTYHVLRFVRTTFDSSVFLHLWLARTDGNLALARIRLGEMAGRLVLA